ncbi:Protein of unknown function [Bacillus wiedmannii]|nr:Protein of unknown function [Bacillus wiedmannii]
MISFINRNCVVDWKYDDSK